jgi:hypothetical protein
VHALVNMTQQLDKQIRTSEGRDLIKNNFSRFVTMHVFILREGVRKPGLSRNQTTGSSSLSYRSLGTTILSINPKYLYYEGSQIREYLTVCLSGSQCARKEKRQLLIETVSSSIMFTDEVEVVQKTRFEVENTHQNEEVKTVGRLEPRTL